MAGIPKRCVLWCTSIVSSVLPLRLCYDVPDSKKAGNFSPIKWEKENRVLYFSVCSTQKDKQDNGAIVAEFRSMGRKVSSKASERCSASGRGGAGRHQHPRDRKLPPHAVLRPPGTGKPTTGLAIAHQLFGVLELNASDDRGINVVRTKIKNFASVAVGSGQLQGGYPCLPFKIIILDEADSMTEDAQNALRHTMETYLKVTRFFFICNCISRIIEPLASRCAKFRFKPLSEEIMSSRILHICKEEGRNLDSEALSTLSSIFQGHLRWAITYLQVIPQEIVQELYAACKSENFDWAKKEVDKVIAEGYPVSQMHSQLFEVEADDISDEQKARICKNLREADKDLQCIVDGADEYLQLLDVTSNTMRAL